MATPYGALVSSGYPSQRSSSRNGHGRELRVGADRAGEHELARAVQPRLLEHVGAHHQVRVPVAPGVRPVGADPADLGREVEHELRLGLVEQPRRLGHVGEVDLDAPRHGDVVAVGLEALDEVRAEEPASARDENAHRRRVLTARRRDADGSRRPTD